VTDADPFRSLLGAYLATGLDPEDRAALERHLESCEACRAELAALAPLPALLRRLRSPRAVEATAAPPGEGPTAHAAGTEDRVAAVAHRIARRRRRARAAVALGTVVAAAGALAGLALAGRSAPYDAL
jgi:anti-sigma factor RsiW